MRSEFNEAVKRVTAQRVGYRCSNGGCQALTSGPSSDPKSALNLGVAAHITAASLGGPRFDPSIDPPERSGYSNAIWLCQNCGKLVDNDPVRFTVDILRKWKIEAETRALALIGRSGLASQLGPDDLWKAVSPYLPSQAGDARIGEIIRLTTDLMPDHSVRVEGREDVTTFIVEPVIDDAKLANVWFEPSFDDSPEGQERRTAFQKFRETGSAVELDESNVPFDQLPPLLKQLVPPEGPYKLKLGGRPSRRKMIMSLEVVGRSGGRFALPYLELLTLRGGSREVHLSNQHQDIPFHITLRLTPEGTADATWEFELIGKSISWIKTLVDFKRVTSEGGDLTLREVNSGSVARATVHPRSGSTLPDSSFMELLEKAIWIEQSIGTSIPVPGRQFFSATDIDQLLWLEEIIRTGRQAALSTAFVITANPLESEDERAFVSRLLKSPGQPFSATLPVYQERLLDTDVDVGPVKAECSSVEICPDDIPAVERYLRGEFTSPLSFRVVPHGEGEFQISYLKWPKAA